MFARGRESLEDAGERAREAPQGRATRVPAGALSARHDASGRTSKIVLADVMKSPVLTVAPDDTLEHASKIMLDRARDRYPWHAMQTDS